LVDIAVRLGIDLGFVGRQVLPKRDVPFVIQVEMLASGQVRQNSRSTFGQ
jgi:hypothetical protein